MIAMPDPEDPDMRIVGWIVPRDAVPPGHAMRALRRIALAFLLRPY
jgi:hypothetical protein